MQLLHSNLLEHVEVKQRPQSEILETNSLHGYVSTFAIKSVQFKRKEMKKVTGDPVPENASTLINKRIEELNDWRGETLSRIRELIKEADPEVLEEWKWQVPVWSHSGIICTGESYKAVVKLTFAKGAALEDPDGLFNSSLDGNSRRAIDIREGEKLKEKAFKKLISNAVAHNESTKKKTKKA